MKRNFYYIVLVLGMIICCHPLLMAVNLLFKFNLGPPDFLKDAVFMILPMTYLVLPMLSLLCFGFKEFKAAKLFGCIFLGFWFVALGAIYHIIFIQGAL